MSIDLCIDRLKLVDAPTDGLLTWLHRFLIGHRFDFAQSQQLEVLRRVVPGAEEYYESDDPALRPPAIGAVQALLDLNAAEVQEALALGYLAGQADGRGLDWHLPPEERAREIVARLGLEELMVFNTSFGYVPTEKATATLAAIASADSQQKPSRRSRRSRSRHTAR